MARYEFASDNVAGAMPEAIEALARFNGGAHPSYGDGEVCARAGDLIRALLDADADVWFAASGTAANALTLAALAQPHEAVLAHEHSHVATDETGAPGLFGAGVGIIGLAGASGRIDAVALAEALAKPDEPHWQAAAALSLTQATEFGTLYPEGDLAALVGAAKAAGLGVHLDGARLANAVAAGFDPTALARLGVDVAGAGRDQGRLDPERGDRPLRQAPWPPLRRPAQARRPADLQGALSRRAVDRHAGERRLDRAAPPTPTSWRRGSPPPCRGGSPIRSRPTPSSSTWTRPISRVCAERLVRLPLHRRFSALHVLLGDERTGGGGAGCGRGGVINGRG